MIYDVCKGVMGQLRGFDGRLKAIEDKQARLSDAFKELNEMMKTFPKESFGSPREVSCFTASNYS